MNMIAVPILVAFVFGVVVCDDNETMAVVGIFFVQLSLVQLFRQFFSTKRIFCKVLVLLSKPFKAAFFNTTVSQYYFMPLIIPLPRFSSCSSTESKVKPKLLKTKCEPCVNVNI